MQLLLNFQFTFRVSVSQVTIDHKAVKSANQKDIDLSYLKRGIKQTRYVDILLIVQEGVIFGVWLKLLDECVSHSPALQSSNY